MLHVTTSFTLKTGSKAVPPRTVSFSVYTLTFLLNLGRLDRICYVDQFIMAYGGLRGGIAFSLCQLTCLQNVPAIKNMLCATIIAVFFTSFVQVRAHRMYKYRPEVLIQTGILEDVLDEPC